MEPEAVLVATVTNIWASSRVLAALPMSKKASALNALKHGAYSNLGLLPGEDPKQYLEYWQALRDEWKPSGATEEDTVHEMALCLWRKSRLGVYERAKRAGKTWAPYLKHSIETEFDLTAMFLSKANVELKMFEASLKRVNAPGDIETKVMSAGENLNPQLEAYVKADGVDPKELLAESEADLFLALLGDIVTPEMLGRDLDLRDRLDQRFDRLTKRLIQMKAMKPALGLGASGRQALLSN